MRILAIETATAACSAALYRDGEIAERFEIAPRRHAERILPMVEDLLAEAEVALAELDALAFGRGPGAFTGVRIAAGVAQGLALGGDLPVAPVSTLAALAWEGLSESGAEYALVALDARMGEVYWGVYRRCAEQGLARVEQVGAPEAVAVPEAVEVGFPLSARAIAIGPGWGVHGKALEHRVGRGRLAAVWPERLPRAAHVADLAAGMVAQGETVAPEAAVPVYLRDRVVNP